MYGMSSQVEFVASKHISTEKFIKIGAKCMYGSVAMQHNFNP